jgi:hypothetical protein
MNVPRRSYCSAAVLLLVAGAVALGISAFTRAAPAPAAAADKPKAPARVFVKKADGTSVRGELVEADGKRLAVRPAEGKTFGEPVEIKWADVKTVSNGLTRERAQAAWKAEHKDGLCETCKGERVTRCETCKGVGHDPAASKDCKTCKGELLVDCSDKKCDKGKVPCPAPCLKLSEGTWKKGADGKMWKSFSAAGGTGKVSDSHIGQVMKVVGGQPELKDCEKCGKTGSITCPTCAGLGDLPCPTCKASKTAADCDKCEAGSVDCATCKGTGLKA